MDENWDTSGRAPEKYAPNPTKVEAAMLRGKDTAPVPAVGITTREQRSAVASAIRSLRYGAHPLRSPHADELVRVFPEVDPARD